MATRVRTPKGTTYGSKSDHMRALFAEGKSVAEVTRLVPGVGYAFAYGVAKRAGLAATAANRRATKSVAVVGSDVTVRIVTPEGEYAGTVIVDMTTGKVRRTK